MYVFLDCKNHCWKTSTRAISICALEFDFTIQWINVANRWRAKLSKSPLWVTIPLFAAVFVLLTDATVLPYSPNTVLCWVGTIIPEEHPGTLNPNPLLSARPISLLASVFDLRNKATFAALLPTSVTKSSIRPSSSLGENTPLSLRNTITNRSAFKSQTQRHLIFERLKEHELTDEC